ncbi:hypothetical protein [Streptomyces mirabilis]|uniref:hypothetical protein n=1 Tax=Streptomyces mirabilis TaxID=68239 RepID=UPI00368E2A8F
MASGLSASMACTAPDFGGRGGGSVADLDGGSSGAGMAPVCSSAALPVREASPLE